MKITATRFEGIKKENQKDVLRFQELLNNKIRTKAVFGYEEKGEEIEKYIGLLESAYQVQDRINQAVKLECGNYVF